MSAAAASAQVVEDFIARWQSAGGSECANYQLFVTELCELLALPKPEPARAEAVDNAYVFERRVVFRQQAGSYGTGRSRGRAVARHPLLEQMAALAAALTTAPQSETQLAAKFTGKGRWKSRLPESSPRWPPLAAPAAWTTGGRRAVDGLRQSGYTCSSNNH